MVKDPTLLEYLIQQTTAQILRLKEAYRATPPQFNTAQLRTFRIRKFLSLGRRLRQLQEAHAEMERRETAAALTAMGVMFMQQDGKFYI